MDLVKSDHINHELILTGSLSDKLGSTTGVEVVVLR